MVVDTLPKAPTKKTASKILRTTLSAYNQEMHYIENDINEKDSVRLKDHKELSRAHRICYTLTFTRNSTRSN